MRQRFAIGPIELPRSAKDALSRLRAIAPEICRGLIIEGDHARGIGRVDRQGKGFEQVPRLLRGAACGCRGGGMPLCNVVQAADRSDEAAGGVAQRVDVHFDDESRAGRLFYGDLAISYGNAARQNFGHCTIVKGKGAAVEAIPATEAAKAVAGIVESRFTSPEGCSAAIVADDLSVDVTYIGSGRKQVEQT